MKVGFNQSVYNVRENEGTLVVCVVMETHETIDNIVINLQTENGTAQGIIVITFHCNS